MDQKEIERIKAEARAETSSLGGQARRDKLSEARRKKIASMGGKANKKRREALKNNNK